MLECSGTESLEQRVSCGAKVSTPMYFGRSIARLFILLDFAQPRVTRSLFRVLIRFRESAIFAPIRRSTSVPFKQAP